jgi:20S proteasome subunit beta 7
MEHHPEKWGMARTDHLLNLDNPKTATTQPIVTGTSVIAVRYKGGVMLAADCLGMA